MKIESLDHLVLTVADIEASCAFCTRVLGMQEVTFGVGRKALGFGVQKINLHQHGPTNSNRRRIGPRRVRPICA